MITLLLIVAHTQWLSKHCTQGLMRLATLRVRWLVSRITAPLKAGCCLLAVLPNDVWLYRRLGDQVILVRWWWLNEIGDRRVSECGTKGMMQWLLIVVKMDLFLDKVWPIRLCSHLQVVGVPILLLLEANLGLKRGCGIRNVFVVTLLGCGGKLLTHQERFYFILIGCLNVILRLDCLVGFLCYAARIL